jgi:trans-aconitate 2-methyltransferase
MRGRGLFALTPSPSPKQERGIKRTCPGTRNNIKFQAERSAPFFDLLALVEIRPDLKVVDLGCGTGELTRHLADTLQNSDVTGLDSSSHMLEKARSLSSPNLHFEHGNQSQLTGEWDLIFSNAALQWSENHAELIPRLYERLMPGGQIAVQVPSNHNHISHQIYRETASEEPFKSILTGFQRYAPVLSIDERVIIPAVQKLWLSLKKCMPTSWKTQTQW